MQVTKSTAATTTYALPKERARQSVETSVEIKPASSGKVIDFSHVTPRQLQAYLDDRLMSGAIDGPDGLYCTTLFGAIPGEWYTEQADVPMDLTGTIESMTEFARGQGTSKLVDLYEGLIDWMKMMEDQPAHVSVLA